MRSKYIVLVVMLLLITGCGYRCGQGIAGISHSSICVPYVEGDQEGFLTNELIYALTKRIPSSSATSSRELMLKVCLQAPIDTNIGFRYANGNERKVVTSDEARLTLVAEVKLIDCATGALVGSCRRVVASIDYDFESDFSILGEDTFSLGQLKMYAQARETSQRSLYKLLAEKIVDSLLCM